MASYLRPRRGKKATAESQNIILKKGEVFFEVPTGGVGKGIGKIKMGDGTTAYKSLPYFLEQPTIDVANTAIAFTETSETDNAALLKKIVTGAKLNVITGAIKNLLSNLNTSVTQLNNDLGYIDADYSTFIGLRNNFVPRGKNLGTFSSISDVETFLNNHKVSSGKFYDIYPFDEVTIKDGTYNAVWIVAGLDTEFGKGDTALAQHHVTLIPKTYLFTARMNSTNTTVGGYYGSEMHQTTLPTVANNLKKVLGNHLLERRVLLSNSINANLASGAGAGWQGSTNNWAWYSAFCTLMSEIQVYGSIVFSSSFFDVGEACSQLPIFRFANHTYQARFYFWLRAVSSTTDFALATGNGHAANGYASYADIGVRPLITIG